MKNIELNWKSFNLDLDAVEAEVKSLGNGKVLGMSANSKLEVHCQDDIDPADMAAISAYWEGLEDDSSEATSYRSKDQIKVAVQAMKDAIPAKTWAQMSAVERALLIGTQPTKAQLIEAELL